MEKFDQLIQSKFHLPFIRPNLVPRTRLQQKIAAGIRGPLTLITAPAGFGKSTLVASCITACAKPVAWLSLDKNDNQVERFLNYLIAALQQVDESLGRQASAQQATSGPVLPEAILTSLINDLISNGSEIVLVLDDYQQISSQGVHAEVTFLLEHCPGNFHLIICTRSDPALPLARLRSRGQLVELRTADLRFTRSEAEQFLNEVMELSLDDQSVSLLEERTEGWIAGLQMAALSLRDREDANQFIENFSGSNRYILEYLSEEVLSRQPEQIRSFLLHTSILDRFCASLCDAVLNQPSGSEQVLEQLDKANLFLIPLDDEHRWYRYHHLFTDLLRTRLQQAADFETVAQLHLRAAEWFERNGFIFDAINHASLAPNNEWVERLIEQNYADVFQHREVSSFRFLTGRLGRELVYRRPWLCIYEAESSLWFGQINEAETLLAEANKFIQTTDPSAETQALSGHYAYLKSRASAMRGQIQQAIELGQFARQNTPTSNLALHLSISVGLGYFHFLAGDFTNAEKILTDTIKSSPVSKDVIEAMRCVLARLYTVQGFLHKAYDQYQQGFQAVYEAGDKQLGARSILNVGVAAILYKWNDLPAALDSVTQGLEFIRYWGKIDDIALAYATLAEIQQAQGKADAALETIGKGAQAIRTSGIFYEAREAVRAAEVKLWLAQGDQSAVARWLGSMEKNLQRENSFTFENEQAHITLARVYLALGGLDECTALLSTLETQARSGGRLGRLLEILILKSLTLLKLDKTDAALTILGECLQLAAPERNIRIFLDEGIHMRQLLARWLAQAEGGSSREFVLHLLSQFNAEPLMALQPADKSPAEKYLLEPLSQRELEVLLYIAEGKTNPEIARVLVISSGTVKAHTASIYRKLDVTNRTEAVTRARQLALLE